MTIGESIMKKRKDLGLSQEELAEILYVSRTAVSKWESGRGYPNIESLKAISKYFCGFPLFTKSAGALLGESKS